MSHAFAKPPASGEASTPWDHVESELIRQAAELTGPLSLQQLAEIGLRILRSSVGVDRASVSLLDPFTGHLKLAAALGNTELQAGAIVAGPRSVSEWVLHEGRGIVLQGRVLTPRIQGMGDGRIRSSLSMPLGGIRGPFGVVSLGRSAARPAFADADLEPAAAALAPLATAIAHRTETDRALRNLGDVHAAAHSAWSPWRTRPLASRQIECDAAVRRSWEHGGTFVASVTGHGGARWILAADVAGHGVRALERARLLEGMFLATAPTAVDLSDLAGRLDRTWAISFEREMPCDAWIVRTAGAGLMESCPLGSGTLHRLSRQETPTPMPGGFQAGLGAKRSVSLRIDRHRLLPGDVLVYANTGVLEAADPAGEPFGVERLRECLAEYRSRSLDAVSSGICDTALMHAGRSRWRVDLMAIAVRFHPGGA